MHKTKTFFTSIRGKHILNLQGKYQGNHNNMMGNEVKEGKSKRQ